MRNWTGDKGLHAVFSFRNDSRCYLNANKLTEEAFVLDILQALCDEGVAVNTKLHLLGLLQEYASVLLTTPPSIEQAVASLQDVFKQSKPGGTTVYKCQLLVTITTILISSDCADSHVDLMREFIEILLDTASQVTTSSLAHLRGASCQCLVEIETCYPGILSRKLEYIYQWCHLETTAVHQRYMSLFVTVLSSVIRQLSLHPDSCSDQSLNQMICDRREPLKPFIYPETLLDLSSSKSEEPLPPHVDVTALQRVAEYVLKFVDLAAPPTVVYIMRQLRAAVSQAPQLSPNIFHPFMSRHMTSMDISIFHVTTKFQGTFGDAMLPSDDSKLHPRLQTTHYTQHPSLMSYNCLLTVQWLTEWSFSETELKQVLEALRPRPFDSLSLQVQKLTTLSVILASSSVEPDQCRHLLMESVSPLLSRVRRGTCGTTAAAYYRVMVAYYSMHADNTALLEDIERVTVTLQMMCAALCWHTLDFLRHLEKVQQHTPYDDRNIVVRVLSALVTEIVGTIHQISLLDLDHQLHVVEMAASQAQIEPSVILQVLSKVLRSTNDVCRHGDWTFGTTVLRVVRCLLRHHDMKGHCRILGEVLHCMMTEYADVDVRERARLYYLLMCNLESKKVSDILSKPATIQRVQGTQNLASIISESGFLPSVRAVTVLKQPLLKLTQCTQTVEDRTIEGQQLPVGNSELLDHYFEFLDKNTTHRKKDIFFNITFTDHLPDFEAIYSLVLQFSTQSTYAPIKDVQVSYLSRDFAPGKTDTIAVELHPEETSPAVLQVSATFLGPDGRTYHCPLDPVSIHLSDLMSPLPCPPQWSRDDLQPLFDQLWTAMLSGSSSERHVEGLETVFCVKVLSTTLRTILDVTLHQFFIREDADGSTCLAAFLPPSSHLLVKVKVDKGGATVRFTMATDNWKILPLMSDYLRTITSVEE